MDNATDERYSSMIDFGFRVIIFYDFNRKLDGECITKTFLNDRYAYVLGGIVGEFN